MTVLKGLFINPLLENITVTGKYHQNIWPLKLNYLALRRKISICMYHFKNVIFTYISKYQISKVQILQEGHKI